MPDAMFKHVGVACLIGLCMVAMPRGDASFVLQGKCLTTWCVFLALLRAWGRGLSATCNKQLPLDRPGLKRVLAQQSPAGASSDDGGKWQRLLLNTRG